MSSLDSVLFIKEKFFDHTSNTDRIPIDDSLFMLQRSLDKVYRSLPSPSSLHSAVVFTKALGGMGDVSAAAKVIHLLKTISPKLHIDWVITNAGDLKERAHLFLKEHHSLEICIRDEKDPVPNYLATKPFDLLINGPCPQEYLGDEQAAEMKIKRPSSSFAYVPFYENFPRHIEMPIKLRSDDLKSDLPDSWLIYQSLFPHRLLSGNRALAMGLYKGSGILIDTSLASIPLSQKYFCHSYLMQIADESLKQDIFEAMNADSFSVTSSSEHFSFNLGYAHRHDSLIQFIECISLHENNKNIVVVLNQLSARQGFFSAQHLLDTLTVSFRKAFFQSLGFSTICIKDAEALISSSIDDEGVNTRKIHLILREKFTPQNMNCMQLAAERILATGDNSAAEAFACRCKLYVYESLDAKTGFRNQQINLARSFGFHKAADLLELFATPGIMGLSIFPSQSLTMQNILLTGDLLSEETYNFCVSITKEYRFQDVFEGHIKRIVYHHAHPGLHRAEYEAIGESFFKFVHQFFTHREPRELSLPMPDLLHIERCVKIHLDPVHDQDM